MRKQVLVTVDRGDPGRHAGSRRGSGGSDEVAVAGAGGAEPEVPAGYRVAEVYFERRGGRSIVGNIYKGKVDNVLPGLEAAFVDIGLDKNEFLHVDEIVIPGKELARRGRAPARASPTCCRPARRSSSRSSRTR